jgi:hypothetical protein
MMYYIMHRTQIMLEDWQYEQLRTAAERQGRSISSLVRDAVTRLFRGSPHRAATKLADIGGLGADPDGRGRDHDEVLYGPRRGRK